MPKMKDTNISSFGKVPYNWRIVKLKEILHTKSLRNTGNRELLSVYLGKGVIPYSNSDGQQVHKPSKDLSNYQNVEIGDFVLNNQQAWRGSVGVSEYVGIISPAYLVYQLEQDLNPKYMNYLLRDATMVQQYEIASRGVGTIQRNLFAPWLLNSWIVLPSAEEQIRIANFLDAKCLELDALSRDIEKEIETLEEYKKSVITEAVTKGLDPNVKMKDSGIEWIGRVPKHWDIRRGKYVLRYVEKPVRDDDGVITCFRDGEVTLRSKRREEGFTESMKEIGYQGIDVGDLVVHGMDGFAGSIGISDSRGKASPVLNNLDTEQNKKYYMYLLRTYAWLGVFIALSTGIRVRTCDTNWGKLRNLFYLLPPRSEQDKITEYIDGKIANINSIIESKKQQQKILSEYKKSLIYEYVTGKKEVV